MPERAIEESLTSSSGSGRRLGESLVARGLASYEDVAACVAEQLALPYRAPPLDPHPDARSLVGEGLLASHRALPLVSDGRVLMVGIAGPEDLSMLDDLRFSTGRPIEACVVSEAAIAEALRATTGADLERLIAALPRIRSGDSARDDLEAAARAAPVVRLVEHVLDRAVAEGASDIHVEWLGDRVRVRFRIDGVLRTELHLPPDSRRPLVSRIKVLAGMDISVRRRPQDGGFTFRSGRRELRVRASTLPVAGGEKAVLRLLDPDGAPPDLESLGFSDRDLELIRRLGTAGQGVILAAGPTGSGKSSSLFAALAELNQEGMNVVTLEDPVERRLPGINQIPVNPRAGLTFPAALRAVLRQDPDVIMVGEIRDRETAEIAMAAAVTGHLVLSTIHTVDAPGAVARLLDMGVPPFLVAGGLTGVVAQRLVRTLCRTCRGREWHTCRRCKQGYSGRTGVFQVLAINDAMRDEIVRGASSSALRQLARQGGMVSLSEDAMRKIAEDVTTPHEVARVIKSDPGASTPCTTCGGEAPHSANACPHCGMRRRRLCGCGSAIQLGWRYCPSCVRPV